ncbi:MAG: exonuclease SbcCD subunit D [Muribaculaceae bacterium]|nr:exonuclease SbcCD subunit D [Muribaculaceae bacterium]
MKILHTSDWHLGHVLYGYDRTEEQQAMLNQIEEIIKSEKPDAMVLSGDVYHTSQPSAAVQTMFTEAIVAMHKACPTMTIVITAGNHDSGTKHEIFQTPWRELKVFAIGNIDKENLDSHIIEVPRKGWIVAVPYTYERNIPEGFFQQLLDKVDERNIEGLPVVMMAHTTVDGCNFTGHDQTGERTIGGIDSVGLNALGTGYDYLALGHIHCPQTIDGSSDRVRYCGTPIAVSFDEAYEHSASIVEIDKHDAAPRVRIVAIDPLHPLVTLPIEGFAPWDKVTELLKDYPDDISAYIRLNVEIVDFLPVGAMEEAHAIAADKRCKVCFINPKRPEIERTKSKALTVQEFQEMKPIDLLKRFFKDKNLPFDNETEEMLNDIINSLNEEERNK